MSFNVEAVSRAFIKVHKRFKDEREVAIRQELLTLAIVEHPILLQAEGAVAVLMTLAQRRVISDAAGRHFIQEVIFHSYPQTTFADFHLNFNEWLAGGEPVGHTDYCVLMRLCDAMAMDRLHGGSDWLDALQRSLRPSPLTPIADLAVYCVANPDDPALLLMSEEFNEFVTDLKYYLEVTFGANVPGTLEADGVSSVIDGAGPLYRAVWERAMTMAESVTYANRWIDPNDMRFVSQVVAELVGVVGADFEAAMLAGAYDLAAASSAPVADPSTAWITDRGLRDTMKQYMETRSVVLVVVSSVEEFINMCRAWVEEYASPLFAPFLWVQDIVSRLGGELGKLVYSLTGVVLEAMTVVSPEETGIRAFMGVVLFGVADLVDQRHRRNPKSVWALLSSRKGARLSNSEIWLTQLSTFSYVPSDTYQCWARDLIRQLERGQVDTSILSVEPPTRQVRYPLNTFGPASNNDLDLPNMAHFHETERETRQVVEALAIGAPLGIDGAWFASAATLQSSIDRYVVPRPVLGSHAKSMISEAADQLCADFPELYDAPRPMSVHRVMKAMEWKYSAGLPFLPAIKTRQQIKQSRWYQALAGAVEEQLRSGVITDTAFHGFPKTDVIPRSKVETDHSAMRSVTAMDRARCILANVLLFERNKRIPPLEAMVLNTLPRREGALQEQYAMLSEHPYLVAADGWRFDSQVPSEVVSLGSARLYANGVRGWAGARAATSMVEAMYASLAHGLVVNLMDGTITRKTGGGGTGSAHTSTDNRDWVRIVLMASWGIMTGRPLAEFKEEVRLGNASDDILMSVSQDIFDRLRDWQETIWVTFGLRFDFDQTTTGDLLHLRFVPEGLLDESMYADLGIPVPAYPLMHDPARLALKRSDYRSDRMRHNYMVAADHVATRAMGHIYLCAHNTEGYDHVLREGVEAATEFLENYFESVTWRVEVNALGDWIGAHVERTDAPSNQLITKAARLGYLPGTSESITWINRQKQSAALWLKQHRFPTYAEVFKLWVLPQDWAKMRPMGKKWARYTLGPTVDIPIIDVVQARLLSFAAVTSTIPVGLTRWSGVDVQVITRPIVTQGFIVEHWIYRKYILNHGVAPKFGEFASKCREGPYGSLTAPNEFWIQLQDSDWALKLNDEVAYPTHMLTGRMVMLTVIYGGIDWLNNVFRMSRLLGFLFSLFFFIMRDLDKWYSLIHLGYWLAHGEASVQMSNMSPRDPFLAQKMMALLLLTFFPLVMFRAWTGIDFIVSGIGRIAELAYYGVRITTYSATAVNRMLMTPGTRWDTIVRGVLESSPSERITRLVAAVGSGKSTSLPVGLVNTGLVRQVIILVPTNALVNNYINPFIHPDEVELWDAGTRWSDKAIHVVTYDRALGMQIPHRSISGICVLFDEPHINLTSMFVAYRKFAGARRLLMTGTPSGNFWDSVAGVTRSLTVASPGYRTCSTFMGSGQFTVRDRHTHVDWFVEALAANRGRPEIMSGRWAVYHPSLEVCTLIARMINASGFEASVTSAGQPHIRSTGVVVGTWSIVTGVNFDPPITAIFDCGFVLRPRPAFVDLDRGSPFVGDNFVHSPTILELAPSSPSDAEQVAGRTGRVQAGLVIASPFAGTGNLPPYRAQVLTHLEWDSVELQRSTGVHIGLVPSSEDGTSVFRWLHSNPVSPLSREERMYAKICLLMASEINGVRNAVMAMQGWHTAGLHEVSLFRRLAMAPEAIAAGVVWPPLVSHSLHDHVRTVGAATSINGRTRIWWGRPLVHYRQTIGVAGYYASVSPDC